MTSSIQPEKRLNRRFALAFTITIKVKQDDNSYWKETTEAVTISRSGAGFYLTRKCKAGQLLSLLLPMPKHLRNYDEDKEFYRVWGLVQHCNPVSGDEAAGYHVGVAFIGKSAPESYHETPSQSYMICGMNEDGFWKIKETATPFVTRKHTRYWTPIEVKLEILDIGGNVVAEEISKTENISYSGSSVISHLNATVGDCCRISSKKHDFSAIAIVRNGQKGKDNLPRLHLEFTDVKFPVEKLDSEIVETEEN